MSALNFLFDIFLPPEFRRLPISRNVPLSSEEARALFDTVLTDPELRSITEKRPALHAQLLAAAMQTLDGATVREQYLSGTPEGFEGIMSWLLRFDVATDPRSGAALRDPSGLSVIPHPDACGMTLLTRFFSYYRKTYLWPLVENTVAKWGHAQAEELRAMEVLAAVRMIKFALGDEETVPVRTDTSASVTVDA